MGGSFGIDAASAINAQGSAGLREFGYGCAGTQCANREADGLQPGGVITGFEFNILKEGAVAAEPTGKAKTFKIGGFRRHWAFETWTE